jgi:hypothetical protein
MALQPPELLRYFQIHNLIHSQYNSLDGGSASSMAATYTQNHTDTE